MVPATHTDADRAPPALEARELSFEFPRSPRPALERVSLRVRAGSFTGLLGPNGAGKTTFVSLVCGLLSPRAGELRIFGQPSGTRDARRAIGFCPQEIALHPTLTAVENLQFFGRLCGLSGVRLRARVEACLETARLTGESSARVERFSGGMKRRLNLATALLHEPRLLLLDEPTVGVDAQSRLAIFEALEAVSAAGTTIVYTTHYMEEVERLCDEIVLIDHGRILAQEATQTFLDDGRRVHTFRLALRPGCDLAALETQARGVGLRVRSVGEFELELCGEDLAPLTAEIARWSAQGAVLSCESQRPNLESRFLALTGQELRD